MSNRKNRKRERGASMLEFAIVAMLVFTIIFGIIEFGWMFSNSLTLQMASHQGGRAAALGKDQTAVNNSINNSAGGTLDLAKLTIQPLEQRQAADAAWAAWTPGTPPTGGTNAQVRVRLDYNYQTLTFVGRAFPNTDANGVRVLHAETVMRYGG